MQHGAHLLSPPGGRLAVGVVLALTVWAGTARAEVPRYAEVSFSLGNEGYNHHAEGGNLGEVQRIPLRWHGNDFTLVYTRPENPRLMRHETQLKGRISADGRTVESLEADDVFYYEHLDGRAMQGRIRLKARNLRLRPGRQPGTLQAEVTGAEVRAALSDVQWIHSHFGTHGLEYYDPSPRFFFTLGQAPPTDQVVLKGTVSAPDLLSDRPGAGFPLAGVPIRLIKDDKEIARALTAADGTYKLSAAAGEKVSLKVELQHVAEDSPRFAVVYDLEDAPIWMRTPPFEPKAAKDKDGKDLPMVVDVSFVFAKDVATDPRYQTLLPDLGFMFAATHKAWVEATSHLGLTLDLQLPLEVRAFHSSGEPGAPVPMTTGEGDPNPCITLPTEYSLRTRRLKDAVVWHEFGHYVMADTFSDLYPRDASGTFHQGYKNPSTTDSWTEGFATFFALLVNVHQNGEKEPVIDVNGWRINLGLAWQMPWSQDDGQSLEEVAVTTLLWDLYDDQANEVKLEASNEYLQKQGVGLEGLITDERPPVAYWDRVSVDEKRLFSILAGLAGAQASPPAAPAGYGHVFDVFQLHAALEASQVGQEKREGFPLDALDELFVAHGFFADVAPQNLFWDEGETVGLTANGGPMTSGPMLIAKREARRYTPLLPNSNLLYDARDQDGGSVELRRFVVEARFGPPYESHDYGFEAWAPDAGRLYVLCPNPSIDLTYRIRAETAEYESTQPLELPCAEYWRAKRAGAQGAFMRHTFEVRRTRGAAAATRPPLAATAPDGSWLVAALVGVAFLAVVGGGVLLLGLVWYLRRTPPAEAPAPVPEAKLASQLTFFGPDGAPTAWPLAPGVLAVGRGEDNDVVLAHAEVSSHHARFVVSENEVVVRDLGSRNGTSVNGQAVVEAALRVGDVVRIGPVSIRVD